MNSRYIKHFPTPCVFSTAGVLSAGLPSVASSRAVARVWSGLPTAGAVAGGRGRPAARLSSGLQLAARVGAPSIAPAVHGGREVGARFGGCFVVGSGFTAEKTAEREIKRAREREREREGEL